MTSEPGATGLFHVGLTVRDLEHSTRFYTEAIGLTKAWHQCIDRDSTRTLVGVPFTTLTCEFLAIPGGGMLELLSYAGVPGHPTRSAPPDPGTVHLCLWVQGLDEILVRARALGGETIAPDPVVVPDGRFLGARVVYLRDPDGFLVELIEPATQEQRDVATTL